MCECFQIGGRFIAEDPDCPAHGLEAQRLAKMAEAEEAERQERVAALEKAIRDLLDTVVPQMRDIGHNAVSREVSEVIANAKTLVGR